MKHETHLIERTNHTAGQYRAVFGNILKYPEAHRILDVGAGDSRFAQETADREVIRLDPDYAINPPEGDNWLAARGDAIPLKDQSIDATFSYCLMQHLSDEEQSATMREMVRVTKKSSPSDVGTISIFPVYKSGALRKVLQGEEFSSVATLTADWDAIDHLPKQQQLMYETLTILNTDALEGEKLEGLIAAVVESGALRRRTTGRDLARRAFMKARGTNIAKVN